MVTLARPRSSFWIVAAVAALFVPVPLAAAESAAIGATVSIDQTALTASLYGASSDVQVSLSGTLHIKSERLHWVTIDLSISGTSWISSVSPQTVRAQSNLDQRFAATVSVPRNTANGTYSLAVRAHDGDSLFPIDTQTAFTISAFRGPLAVSASLLSGDLAPGGTARWSLDLRNLASFEVDYLADFSFPTGFTANAIFPPSSVIAPGGDAAVLFELTVPRSTPAGDYAWSVLVSSPNHPEISASFGAPFQVTAPLAPPPPGSPDLLAEYGFVITVGIVVAGFVVFFSLTEIGYLALAFSLLVPLFTRLKREKVLDNFTRGQIYGHIQANPGAHYSALQQVLDLENGVLAYHLRVLMRENYIVARNEGVFKRFYPRDYRIPKGRTLLTRLQVDILEHVEKTPGITQRELTRALGESKQVISYNVGVLRDGQLLAAERRGRDVVLRPLEAGSSALADTGDDDASPSSGPSELTPL